MGKLDTNRHSINSWRNSTDCYSAKKSNVNVVSRFAGEILEMAEILAKFAASASAMSATRITCMLLSSDCVVVAVRLCVNHVEVMPFARNAIQLIVRYVQTLIM